MSETDLRCKFCFKPFSTKSNKLKHERKMHSAKKKKEIARKFKRSSTRSHPCSVCGFYFTTNSNMNRLKREAHNTGPKKKFRCNVCNKRYATKGNLKLHLECHKKQSRNPTKRASNRSEQTPVTRGSSRHPKNQQSSMRIAKMSNGEQSYQRVTPRKKQINAQSNKSHNAIVEQAKGFGQDIGNRIHILKHRILF